MKFKIKYYDTSLFCDGIVIYWLKEIHINKKWKNTTIAQKIINHELKHLYFIEKLKKEKNPLKKTLIFMANNIFDYFDCYKLMILKILYNIKNKKNQ